MGYAFMTAGCFTCGKLFTFNPMKVPSVRDKNNVRQPVCRDCVESANKIRKTRGLPSFTILDGAYEACDESELP
jgi:hypothetical protein